MNKNRVNGWVVLAAEALNEAGIAVNGKVDPGFRGQIATFGAAVTMGSLKAAAAFFAKQGGAAVPRENLLCAMYYIVQEGKDKAAKAEHVFEYICANDNAQTREKFLDAAIALKLAMNLYDLSGEEAKHEKSESAV